MDQNEILTANLKVEHPPQNSIVIRRVISYIKRAGGVMNKKFM